MTFTNVALSLIGVAILALIPCGCILTGRRISNRTNRRRTDERIASSVTRAPSAGALAHPVRYR
jgi:hypothetical protein